jgi:undecaprenyl-phosphate 4-deoxy-4-formamido-L-arabinose transferase
MGGWRSGAEADVGEVPDGPGLGISVIVPVFNSEQTIEQLVDGIERVLPSRAARWEIVLVDDGSSDSSWTVIEKLASNRDRLVAIRLARNFGEHNAVLCGIRAARLDVIVTLDDDLQQPPTEIPVLLDALTPDVDLVYGVSIASQHRRRRRITTLLAKRALQHVFGVQRATVITSFRAFRSTLSDVALGSPGPLFSLDNMFAGATTRIAAVDVRHDPRTSGSTQYTFPKLYAHAMNMVAGSATSPLKVPTLLGCAWMLLAGVIALALVGAAILGRSVPYLGGGLFVLAAMTTGSVLVSLGILGEYVARMLMEASGRPPYIVDDTVGRGEPGG